ncbi:cytochrome c biogenesis protein CcsA [Geobacter sp.]|uniref:cytochrome c biogenesis protein CcsA n=1 Tax=Geobacter sp. TaxID=46610 RepID=UPI00261ED1F3|nr:cytochrome c biogenesis protein CcsA [Geobacter sp.]
MDRGIAYYVAVNWIIVFFYVVATIANVYGLVFGNEKMERRSFRPVACGFVIHTTSIILWWRMVGHGPYMAPSEVLSSVSWFSIVMFFLFLLVYPRLRPVSIFVFPSAFLMLAIANFYNPGIRTLPPTFGGVWLVFHIAFYKIALGTLIIAVAFSVFYLMKGRGSQVAWLQRLPELSVIDLYAYRFAGFGFIFWAIAMLAGSIWAYKSWGRYWGWDPVETWSLITWLFFGVYLHLRRFFRWNGSRAAWFFVFCFIMSLISYFVTSHMGSSVHAEYFR